MKRRKPVRDYEVHVRGPEPVVISGETFFAARAAYCLEMQRAFGCVVQPDEVRPVQPARVP